MSGKYIKHPAPRGTKDYYRKKANQFIEKRNRLFAEVERLEAEGKQKEADVAHHQAMVTHAKVMHALTQLGVLLNIEAEADRRRGETT